MVLRGLREKKRINTLIWLPVLLKIGAREEGKRTRTTLILILQILCLDDVGKKETFQDRAKCLFLLTALNLRDTLPES
jgi:hypothetical protein